MSDLAENFVCLREISYAFRAEHPVLERFSMSIAKGECVGVSGPSGCGKTTLALIAAGHIRPDSGSVEIGGHVVTGRPQRDSFLIHQDADLFPWLPVERQIAFVLRKSDHARVRELIELARLRGFEKYYPHQLSGGMKKRLAIARALAVGAKLLIFDESFGALDFDLRREVFADLKKIIAMTQTSALLISHDPRDFHAIVQREIVLH